MKGIREKLQVGKEIPKVLWLYNREVRHFKLNALSGL